MDVRIYALDKAMLLATLVPQNYQSVSEVLVAAKQIEDFLNYKEDKFGLKEAARQEVFNRKKIELLEFVEMLNKINK